MRLTRLEMKQQTRRELLQAAHESFAHDGYHATRLDRVAERAGFTKGAVYSAFTSKADLFLAVYEERVDVRRGRLRAAAASLGSMKDLAEGATAEWERVLREDTGWTSALTEFWVVAAREEAVRERFLVAHRAWRDELASVIANVSGRTMEEGEQMAMTVIAVGNGLALEGLLGENAAGALGRALQQVIR